jgi:hypothetical protein
MIPIHGTAPTSPRVRSGKLPAGEVEFRAKRRKSGEGTFPKLERLQIAPYPARSFAARHPLPASRGEGRKAEAEE